MTDAPTDPSLMDPNAATPLMRGVTYQREPVHQLWSEIPPLLRAHYDEIASFRDIPLDPDVDLYGRLEDQGLLRCYTARESIDGLIGYAVFLVSTNPHYRTSLQARCDVVFLIPDQRRGRLGLGLLRYAHAALTADGVQVISHHVKHTHPALGAILARLGFEPLETNYMLRTGA